MSRALCALVLGVVLAHAAEAQQVEVRVGRGPYYVGESIEVQVVAQGFEEDPVPTQQAPAPASGRLEFTGVSPNISSQVTVIGGRVTQSKQVSFVYRYRFLSGRPGKIELGPFRIAQGTTVRSTPTLKLVLAQVSSSDRLRVELGIPEHPLIVGGRQPVTLEWWIDSGLRKNLHGYTLRVPLFERSGPFQFFDPEENRGKTQIKIETSSGTLELYGDAEQRVVDGRRYLVVTATRTLVPLEVGSFEVAPASVIVNEGLRWQRDFFGGRRATRVRKLRAADQTRRIQVKPLPMAGRTASFAGAIGKGFSLEVTADRSVVKVGDPITLTLKLRGEGNLESAGLPPLAAEGGLSPSEFRLPDDDATGVIDAGEKNFGRVVRVIDPSVQEIPAIAYSWFDMESGTYQTTYSRPIALSVTGAEMVRAQDVFSSAAAREKQSLEGRTALREEGAPEASASRLRVTGADLAIERDATKLLRHDGQRAAVGWVLGGLYGIPLILVLVAWLERRRASIDPEVLRRRKALKTEHRRILAALKQGDRTAAAEISGALRKMLAEAPEARSPEIDDFLAECDAVTYAPAEEARAFTQRPEFERRARSLSDAILENAP